MEFSIMGAAQNITVIVIKTDLTKTSFMSAVLEE